MKITHFSKYEELSDKAAEIVLDEIRAKPDLLLCAATGNSPQGLYASLALQAERHPKLFSEMRVIKLDEWVGVSPGSEASCEGYIQKHLVRPLDISSDRYFAFNPMTTELDAECLRMQNLLQQNGPIDLCVLGLGKNGHIGFNEPGDSLQDHCHGIRLSQESRTHDMINELTELPTHGITIGMQDILASRKIIIIISGEGKEEAKRVFFSQKVSSWCPATYLWKHDNVECLLLDD